jgi:hypothetical protein
MRVTKNRIYWCAVGGSVLAGAGIIALLFMVSPQDARSRMSARGLNGRSGNGSLVSGSTAKGKAKKGQRFNGVTLAAGRADASLASGLLGVKPDELGPGNLGEGRSASGAKGHAHGAGGRDGSNGLKKRAADQPRRRLTNDELAKLREALSRPEAEFRLAALRLARNYDTSELEPDIRNLLTHETNIPVKRVAVQVLALGDVAANLPTLETMRQDKDSVVRVNSAVGLSRAGDDNQEAWLLSVFDSARQVAPHLVPVLSSTLEAPDMKSPVLIARYEQVANDPTRDPAVRARATAIVAAKLATH